MNGLGLDRWNVRLLRVLCTLRSTVSSYVVSCVLFACLLNS